MAVSPQRLLAAMGLVMIVGGLLVQRTRVVGGVLVAAAVVVALCLIYTHTWSRTTNVWVWSAPIVLAVLGAVFAGLALKAEIEPVGRPPVAALGTDRRAARAARRGSALGLIPSGDKRGGGGEARQRLAAPAFVRASTHQASTDQASSRIVTGPSLTSVTCMCAPKTPVATGTPAARTAATKAS